MTYLWVPLLFIAILYVIRCIGVVLTSSDNYDYDRYSVFTKIVGWSAVIGIFIWGFGGIAMCGHELMTKK